MDNLSSPKVKGVFEAIESVKVQVFYLPPYSLTLTQSSLRFSKLKQLIQSAGKT